MTPDQEFEVALEYLENDQTGSVHLTTPITDCLVKGSFDQRTTRIVLAHLRTCDWCPGMLRDTLHLSDVPADHPACALLSQTDPWFSAAQDGLDSLRDIPANWDGDGAETPNDTAITNTRRALDIFQRMNFRPDRIAPSAEGGVMLSFYVGKRYGDIEIFNTGEILAVTSDGTGQPGIWPVQDDETAITVALENIQTTLHSQEAQIAPASVSEKPELTEKQKGLVALLDSWRKEDQTDDPDELDKRDRELTEFKANMNRWRAEEGRGPVYP